MPTILPRTKETEKAEKYSVPDLIIELAKKMVQDTRKGVKKKVKQLKKPTDAMLTDLALAAQGGVLRPVALAQMMKTLNVYHGLHRPKEAISDMLLRVPEKELRRIKAIKFNPHLNASGEHVSDLGNYDTVFRELRPTQVPGVELNPIHMRSSTLSHEFTHARQNRPDVNERALAALLRKFTRDEWELAKRNFDKYFEHSPTERHAEMVGDYIASIKPKRPWNFDTIYTRNLINALTKYKKDRKIPTEFFKSLAKKARSGDFDEMLDPSWKK